MTYGYIEAKRVEVSDVVNFPTKSFWFEERHETFRPKSQPKVNLYVSLEVEGIPPHILR